MQIDNGPHARQFYNNNSLTNIYAYIQLLYCS